MREKTVESNLLALATVDQCVTVENTAHRNHLVMLRQAIELLPPQRRQVIRLCKLDAKSYKEVSEMLGISVSTISDHIVKGTKSIRDHFDKNS